MAHLVSLLQYMGSSDALQQALLPYLASSGLTLPEDYQVIERLKSQANLGMADAVVYVHAGEAVGLIAWHRRDGDGHLMLFYVLPTAPQEAAAALLAHALQVIRAAAPDGDREIFAELPEAIPAVQDSLWAAGFVGAERQVMHAALDGQPWDVQLPDGYTLHAWAEDDVDAAAQVIYEANRGTVDAYLLTELRTLENTRVLLRNTLAGRYGSFDPQASGVVLAPDRAVAGVLLATRRSDTEGFVADVSVLPQHRRRGLARALLHNTHHVFVDEGVTVSFLGVTTTNPARHLYVRLGYETVGVVWSYVYPPPPGWPDDEADGSGG